MIIVLSLAVKAFALGFFLWLAGKTSHVRIGLKAAVLCALTASLVALVPFVGWLLSIWVLFSMLQYYTRADVVPDLVLLVLLGQLFAMAAGALLPGNPSDRAMARIQLEEQCMEDASSEACQQLEHYPQSEAARRHNERMLKRIEMEERCMNDPDHEGCDAVLLRSQSEAARRQQERVIRRIELERRCQDDPSQSECKRLELRH